MAEACLLAMGYLRLMRSINKDMNKYTPHPAVLRHG
jgi:hypothetical protein